MKNENKICPRCGNEMEGNRCPYCGYDGYVPMDEKKLKRIRLIVSIVLVAIALTWAIAKSSN